MIARSIREASALKHVRSLLLRRSEDLVCRNMLCEKVGEPCVCRLDLVLSRIPQLQVGNAPLADALGACSAWECVAIG